MLMKSLKKTDVFLGRNKLTKQTFHMSKCRQWL